MHHTIHQSRQLHLADLATLARLPHTGSEPLLYRALPNGALPNSPPEDVVSDKVLPDGALPHRGPKGAVADSLAAGSAGQHRMQSGKQLHNGHAVIVPQPTGSTRNSAAGISAAGNSSNAGTASTSDGSQAIQHQAAQPAQHNTQQVAASVLSNGTADALTDRHPAQQDHAETPQATLQLPNGSAATVHQVRHQQPASELGEEEQHSRCTPQAVSAKDLRSQLLKPVAAWADADPDLVKQAQALTR